MIDRYGNGATRVAFGTGDICIRIGGVKGCGVLMFREQEPQPIGFSKDDEADRGVYWDDYPVSMMFTHPDSVDMLIQSLEWAKRILTGETGIDPGKQESEG